MAKGKSPQPEGSFTARLFIIAAAVGIVVLGVQPIRNDLRRYYRQGESYVRSNLPLLFGDGRLEDDRAKNSRARLVLGEQTPRAPEITVDKAAEKQELDRLSKEDRKQLSDLVNGF